MSADNNEFQAHRLTIPNYHAPSPPAPNEELAQAAAPACGSNDIGRGHGTLIHNVAIVLIFALFAFLIAWPASAGDVEIWETNSTQSPTTPEDFVADDVDDCVMVRLPSFKPVTCFELHDDLWLASTENLSFRFAAPSLSIVMSLASLMLVLGPYLLLAISSSPNRMHDAQLQLMSHDAALANDAMQNPQWPESINALTEYPDGNVVAAVQEEADISSDDFDQLCGWKSPDELIRDATTQHSAIRTPPDATVSTVSLICQRTENQDYVLAFELYDERRGSRLVLVVADGLGGHRGGRPASFVCARSVLLAAATKAAMNSSSLLLELTAAAERGVQDFAHAYFAENECMTTALVVVMDEGHYLAAWLGDGGMQLRRSSGEWIQVVEPHREPGTSNIVTALLGPVRVGHWRHQITPREAGDWLVLGTDGAMDRVADWEVFLDAPISQVTDSENSVREAFAQWWLFVAESDMSLFDDNLSAIVVRTEFPIPQSEQATKSRFVLPWRFKTSLSI